MSCSVFVPQDQHEKLRLALMAEGRQMMAASTDEAAFAEARARLTAFCFDKLLPHLDRDERWLQKAEECPEGRLLAQAMRTEARALTAAVYELAAVTGPCEAMAATRVVHTLLAAHSHHAEVLAGAVA